MDLILLTCLKRLKTVCAHIHFIFDCMIKRLLDLYYFSHQRVSNQQCCNCCNVGWSSSYLLKLQPSSTKIHRMGESCVQGLVRFAVVGTFPFSDFHETTEQTKMASLIQHDGGRWLRHNDPESRLVSRKKLHIWLTVGRDSFLVHLSCVCQRKTGPP